MRPGKLSLDEPWVQGPGGVGELREHAEAATRLPSGPAMGQECGVCEEVRAEDCWVEWQASEAFAFGGHGRKVTQGYQGARDVT